MANKKGAVKPGSSREEVEQRIAHMRRLIVTCEWNERTRHRLTAKLCKQWDVSPRMVRDYAHRARRDIDAATHVDPKELDALRQIALMRVEWLISKAINKGSIHAAIQGQDLWCKIAGVDELARRRDTRDEAKHAKEMAKVDPADKPTGDAVAKFEVHLSYPERPGPPEPKESQ